MDEQPSFGFGQLGPVFDRTLGVVVAVEADMTLTCQQHEFLQRVGRAECNEAQHPHVTMMRIRGQVSPFPLHTQKLAPSPI